MKRQQSVVVNGKRYNIIRLSTAHGSKSLKWTGITKK